MSVLSGCFPGGVYAGPNQRCEGMLVSKDQVNTVKLLRIGAVCALSCFSGGSFRVVSFHFPSVFFVTACGCLPWQRLSSVANGPFFRLPQTEAHTHTHTHLPTQLGMVSGKLIDIRVMFRPGFSSSRLLSWTPEPTVPGWGTQTLSGKALTNVRSNRRIGNGLRTVVHKSAPCKIRFRDGI